MGITANGIVTLNGAGVYIFQSGGALTTGANSQVVLANGACANDVFWGPTATSLGATSTFVGNILDPAGIGIGHFTTLLGRALTGLTVTADADTITVPPACVSQGGVFLGKSFSPAAIIEGCGGSDFSTLTIILSNPNVGAATITSLTDTLPAGTQVAATPNAGNTCGGTFAPSAGDAILTMTGGSIPGGAPGTCTVQVDVCATLAGSYANTLPVGTLVTSNGNNANSALATLTVNPAAGSGAVAPTVAKSFSPVLINAHDVSTLTIILSNPSNDTDDTNATLTDILPAGVVIADPKNVTNSCGGTLTAKPGTDTIVLSGGTIPHGSGSTPGTCTITVEVRALFGGTFVNTLNACALTVTPTDDDDTPLCNAAPAVATLTAVPASVVPSIPTLNEWGAIFFMVLAGLGSIYYLRKYRRV